MPNRTAEEESTPEEPHATTTPKATDEQDQDGPRGHDGKSFMEHAHDVMEEHETLLRLLAESERQCRESRTQGLPDDLPDRVDGDDQPGCRSCPDP